MSQAEMAAFQPYVRSLEDLVTGIMHDPDRLGLQKEQVRLALDGQPNKQLREVVNIETLREHGAFFTSSPLRKRTLSLVKSSLGALSSAVDPTCGVGDLLVAYAHHLPLGRDIRSTVTEWGERIRGFDIHPEFVQATKARLVLTAIQRGASLQHCDTEPLRFEEIFPHILVQDSLMQRDTISIASHILLNPPYAQVMSPTDCTWATGKVSAAAIFTEMCMVNARVGARVVAILPDVLRTGTRYQKWRDRVERLATVHSIQEIGQFDPSTDIDVFLLNATISASPETRDNIWWNALREASEQKVANFFDVHVGPVVPHRDPEAGENLRYICARDLSGLTSFDTNHAKSRLYLGTSFLPPFVVVRRTTRPDSFRPAVGTIITGANKVAVENHLIVLKPKNNSLASCQSLLAVLDNPQTKTWLNHRIRCRHLTVSSLTELPWWNEDPNNEPH